VKDKLAVRSELYAGNMVLRGDVVPSVQGQPAMTELAEAIAEAFRAGYAAGQEDAQRVISDNGVRPLRRRK
jgi:hypothetical protein